MNLSTGTGTSSVPVPWYWYRYRITCTFFFLPRDFLTFQFEKIEYTAIVEVLQEIHYCLQG
uniref:Uncharacterized protein n=1 Tax=Romanomermis culicivorax TaxID=13658 RepID=A0A915JX49_ROMCU